jgi:hypothetical protein
LRSRMWMVQNLCSVIPSPGAISPSSGNAPRAGARMFVHDRARASALGLQSLYAVILAVATLIAVAHAQDSIPSGTIPDGEPCMDPPTDEITASRRCAGSPFLSGRSVCYPGPVYNRTDPPSLYHSPWLCKDSGFDCAFPGTHGGIIGRDSPRYFMGQNVYCLPGDGAEGHPYFRPQ